MPRNPGPVRPRRKDERAYEAMIRREVLDPLFVQLRAGLVDATGLAQALRRIDEAAFVNLGRGLPEAEIAAVLQSVEGYHRERLIKTFRSALGVDIRPLLAEPQVAAFMAQKVSDNVDLIKSIPPPCPRFVETTPDAPYARCAVR